MQQAIFHFEFHFDQKVCLIALPVFLNLDDKGIQFPWLNHKPPFSAPSADQKQNLN